MEMKEESWNWLDFSSERVSSCLTATTLESLRYEPIRSELLYNFAYTRVFGAQTGPSHPPVYRGVGPHTQLPPRQTPTHYRNQSPCHKHQLNPPATVSSVVNTTNTECKEEKRGVTVAGHHTQQSPTNEYGLGGNPLCDRTEHKQRKGKRSGKEPSTNEVW